ncbi:hypothetical protein HMPREF0658_0296 [Hoylesella marshii DSM 16973 = JCM 13450]|uniref:Uncharacterized protein n=1 Tax=Hoylesella marshii DSM 16973 = JCM 13450 TaxID=862515 RepID=E0NQ45_9BACT|nr:hypothetical protein HMPREF0658_0296 [Hoylesella marshii DSM 16973 = JCM 13450]
MKWSYKSHLRRKRRKKIRYEVCLSSLLRQAGVYFSYGFGRQVEGVGGKRVRDLSSSE